MSSSVKVCVGLILIVVFEIYIAYLSTVFKAFHDVFRLISAQVVL